MGSVGLSFVGLFNFQTSYQCVSSSLLSSLKDSEKASSSLKAARAFGVLAPLLGGVVTIWVFISIMLTGTNKCCWITMASLLIASTVFQLITFIAFNDEGCKDDAENEIFVDCSIAEGSAFAISASIFYLLSSIGMFLTSHPKVPLVQFEEGWRAREGANNHQVAHTPIEVNRNGTDARNVSSTSPPMEQYNNTNLRNAGASISRGGEDEKSGTLSSVDADGMDKFGVEL